MKLTQARSSTGLLLYFSHDLVTRISRNNSSKMSGKHEHVILKRMESKLHFP
jgi:hypothetical protein